MGGQPLLIVAGGKEPNQRIWEAIRQLAPAFSINDVARMTGQLPLKIETYLRSLMKAGFVVLVHKKVTIKESNIYRLENDEGVEHPRLNGRGERTYVHLRDENIWRALRIVSGPMSANDLALLANTDNVKVHVVYARQYLNALTQAGYLEKHREKSLLETYRLIPRRDTGPRPPEVRQLQSLQVYDPNTNKLVYAKTTGTPGADRSLIDPSEELRRVRSLLQEWLSVSSGGTGGTAVSADLMQRTLLELATQEDSGGLQ